MPRPRRKSRYSNATTLPVEIRDFLITGIEPPSGQPYSWECFWLRTKETDLSPYWPIYGQMIVDNYIREHPGRRPWGWYVVDAPRYSWAEDDWQEYNGKVSEPRQRIGGAGETSQEYYGHRDVHFRFGVPYYWQWIDPDDPPLFESEAAYLDRHGLLTASEKKCLSATDFEPESIITILNLDEEEERQEYEEYGKKWREHGHNEDAAKLPSEEN